MNQTVVATRSAQNIYMQLVENFPVNVNLDFLRSQMMAMIAVTIIVTRRMVVVIKFVYIPVTGRITVHATMDTPNRKNLAAQLIIVPL